MAENTLTALIPDIYESLDIVSREMTGLIPAVTLSASAERASLNQNIDIDIEPDYAAGDTISPAMVVPDPTGETSAVTTITISNSKSYSFGFNGEGQKGVNTGPGYFNVRANKIAQRIRTLVNEVEADLAGLQTTFSRSYGTAGTTPFATAGDFTDATQAKRILLDNGAPEFDNQLVMNSAAGAILTGKQAAANIAGTDAIQRQGILLPLAGLDLRQSAQIETGTAGTAASATTDNAGYSVGDTVITLASAGTGTILAGDSITFAGDTNIYVVSSGDADVSGGGTITLAAPGLRVAMSAATKAITMIATSARNMCFARSALVLAARAPARPSEGDLAEDVVMVTDPRSGLTFEFSMYKGYRKVRYEVALAWGVKNIKPEHTALLLG
jgi:hypothetical protein